MMDKQTKGHRERVRERYSRLGSFDSYEPYEVLEFLLFHSIPRADTKLTAKNLIKTFGSLGGVINADPTVLAKQPGVGKATALFLHALSELPSYTSQEDTKTIRGSGDLGAYAMMLTKGKTVEELYAVALNSKNEIMSHKKLASGKFSSVMADARDIITFALECGGEQIALVHNHTNGFATPSGDDIKITDYLAGLIGAVGVKLVDHIITTETSYFSFADAGKIQKDRK